MKNVVFAAPFAALLTIAAPIEAAAQAATAFNTARITRVCATNAAQCQTLVSGILANLSASGLPDSAINSALARLAAAVTNASGGTGADAGTLSSLLVDISEVSTDEQQAASIVSVANLVAAGDEVEINPGQIVAQSPT